MDEVLVVSFETNSSCNIRYLPLVERWSATLDKCSKEVVILILTLEDHVDLNVFGGFELGVNGEVEFQNSPLKSECQRLTMVRA